MKRRARRPDDGRFLPKDAKLWRRLLKHAGYAAAQPFADTSRLHKAADACGKAVPPPGFAHRDSPFLALVMQGRAFGRVGQTEREARAEALGELVTRCETALSAPTGPPPRADIFG